VLGPAFDVNGGLSLFLYFILGGGYLGRGFVFIVGSILMA
jgi:hypothetical protein